MLILSQVEDIGNANLNALLLATSCFQAVTMLGYPECMLTLSQTAIYLAASVKNNASYTALQKPKSWLGTGDQPVPLALRNAPTAHEDMQYGKDYPVCP